MATQRVIAQHLGLSERRCRDVLLALGLPTRGCDLDIARHRYIEHLRELAAGRGASDGEWDLVAERAALARAQREQIELAMAAKREELVDAAAIRREFVKAAHRVRSAILSVPHRLAAVLAAETDPDRVHELQTVELETALTALADHSADQPTDEQGGNP